MPEIVADTPYATFINTFRCASEGCLHLQSRHPGPSPHTMAGATLPADHRGDRAASVGITKVHDADDLDEAIELARSHDPRIILEATIEGREIECGVLEGLDGAEPEASLPAE